MQNNFQQGSFLIPEGTTPDMLRAKRERLAALMPRYGQAKYVGEGLGQLFSGIAQGRQNRAMDAYEGDQRKSAADMFNGRGPLSVLGMSTQGAPAGPNQDIADEALAAIGADGLPTSLVQSESGGNWNALNSEGYGGRGQFGTARLADAARAGVIPAGMTGETYSRAPKHVQLAVENWHKRDTLNNLGQYVGVDVDGPGPIPPLTEDSLLAVAHLGGQGGARRFIESGGQYNPADSNGTSLASYATRHANGQGGTMSAQGRAPTGGADVAYLMQLASNPWLSPEQRSIINMELQQAQKQADPSYQMELEMQRLQLDALRNPRREPIKVGDVLLDPNTMQPIYDGRDPSKDGPNSVREYEYYVQGAIARGEQPMPFEQFKTLEAAAGNPARNPDGGAYVQPVTKGQEEVDKAYAKEYVEWTQGGGADMMGQIATIESIADRLDSGEQNLTGPGVGSLPDAIGAFTNPDAVSAREDVESVVQRNLRILLGAQFTQAEGDRLIARAYNPRLPEAENAKRLRRLTVAMRAAAQARQSQAEYYDQNGTLTGWQGKVWTPGDFRSAIDGKTDLPPAQGGDTSNDPLGLRQ